MPWYIFTPPNTWTKVTGLPPTCPGPNNFLCTIQADYYLGHPLTTSDLLSKIALAIENRVDTKNVRLRPTH